MASQIIWQPESNNPDNPNYLALISQWWEKLDSQEILWQQRLIPPSEELTDIDWNQQGFDEKLSLKSPQVRGITLYWRKPTLKDEINTTPRKLILDINKGDLYIYPQSQPQLVIRVNKPQIVYQTIEIKDPLIVGNQAGENYILMLRDKEQQLQVKITLSPNSLRQLMDNLPQ